MTGESALDYRIRITKKALNPNNVAAVHPIQGLGGGSLSHEFGFGTGPIARRYLWLSIKLITLYVVKGLRRLLHRK